MQPSNPMQPRGSFSKPQELVKSIEKHEMTRGPVAPTAEPKTEPVKADESSVPAQAEAKETEEQKVEREERERQERITKLKEDLGKLLGITITSEDVKNYLFKGILSKEVTLVDGVMKGTLQTLRISDLQEIDIRMAAIRDAGKNTSQGIANEEAIITLSYSWTHADGRALGAKPAEREEKIRKMAGLFIEQVANARVNFDTLVRLCLQERNVLKK